MRKLGKGQSVTFCAPMEVEREILRHSRKTSCDTIEVADVLLWCIWETFIHTKKCIPLWVTQGMRYQRRHAAWSGSSNDGARGATLNVAKSLLEAEAQTLRDRYGFGGQRSEEQILLNNSKDESLSAREEQVEAIRTKCREFNLASFSTATLQEEQERELSPENEQERQVERPPVLTPYKHSVHEDVRRFIHQGILDHRSSAFRHVFEVFGNTSAVQCLEKGSWPANLLVTADFARTVQTSQNELIDSFLRPVHWVASSRKRNAVDFLVLSPYEAHELLPIIRQHKAVTLHVYSPRVNMSMRTLEDLSFCAIPAVPKCRVYPLFAIMQLNLFAGQLYVRSYEDYLALCRFLGLCFRPLSDDQSQIACDGFISPARRAEFDAIMGKDCPFTRSPVGFLSMLMALRRKGQGFQRSHLGRILRGELLKEEHF
jgi:hypothetical protein